MPALYRIKSKVNYVLTLRAATGEEISIPPRSNVVVDQKFIDFQPPAAQEADVTLETNNSVAPAAAAAATVVDPNLIRLNKGTLITKLRRKIANSRGLPVAYTSPPTLTKFTSAQVSGQSVLWNDARLSLLSARWVQRGANPRATPYTTDLNGDGNTLFGNSGSIFLESYTSKFEIWGMFDYYRVYVDELDGKGWQNVATIASGDTATVYFVPVDLTTAKLRRVRIDCGGSTQFYGINLSATSSVFAYTRFEPLRAVVLGDSFAEGTGATYGPLDGYVVKLGKYLGIDDIIAAGSGGTGLLQVNGSRVKYRDRIARDVIGMTPDLVFIQLTQNDNSFSASAVQAELLLLINAIKAGCDARIVIIGVWDTTGTSSIASALNTALKTFAASIGIDYLDWYGIINGTGKVGAPASNGNADLFVSNDGTHPSDAGYDFRAKIIFNLFAKLVDGWST